MLSKHYHVAIKAALYRKAVQVCYIPIPCDKQINSPGIFSFFNVSVTFKNQTIAVLKWSLFCKTATMKSMTAPGQSTANTTVPPCALAVL